jgi:hypothetical protein
MHPFDPAVFPVVFVVVLERVAVIDLAFERAVKMVREEFVEFVEAEASRHDAQPHLNPIRKLRQNSHS